MYGTTNLLIIQITTVHSRIINLFGGHLSAEHFFNYLLANYAFLNFDLLSIHSLNFPKISASFLIGPFFIIGDSVYRFGHEWDFMDPQMYIFTPALLTDTVVLPP